MKIRRARNLTGIALIVLATAIDGAVGQERSVSLRPEPVRPAHASPHPRAEATGPTDAINGMFGLALGVAVLLTAAGTAWLVRHRAKHELAAARAELASRSDECAMLQESESHYRTLFESTTDAVMLLDERGFFECNDATLRIFGCETRDQFIACHPSELSTLTQPDGRDSREAADERIRQALAEGTAHFEWRHQRLSGEAFSADVLLTRVHEKDRDMVMALVRDISEQKQTEQELVRSVKQSRRANAVKTMFLANVSHELRTPLHAILSFGSLATRKIDRLSKHELLEYLELINESGKSLLDLIDALLDLSKLESDRADMVFREIDLTSLLLNVIDEHKARAVEKRIDIQISDSEVTIPLVCDQARIKQLVRNVLDNAVKYAHRGTNVQVHVVEEGDSVVVSVADRGVGIPKDELKTIFDKFVQSSKTRSGAGGTGLGLAICREIVLAHRGQIWAENRPQGGTLIAFRLPLKPSDKPAVLSETTLPIGNFAADDAAAPGAEIFVNQI